MSRVVLKAAERRSGRPEKDRNGVAVPFEHWLLVATFLSKFVMAKQVNQLSGRRTTNNAGVWVRALSGV